MNRFDEQPVALITGASRRIGAAIASYLHEKGYRVLIHYHRSQEKAQELAQRLNQKRTDSALIIAADLRIKDSATHLIARCNDWGKRLDLLVNNASIFKKTNCSAVNEKDWEEQFITNVQAPFWLSLAAFPILQKTNGSIINITDIHAENPLKGYSEYCQSKAALAMQTKSLALEFAPAIRVNAVAPGAIAWPEHDNALEDAVKEKIIAATPLKAHGKPEYIAQAVHSLAQNPFITGQILYVDGGRSL